MLSETTYRRIVRVSAAYDLIIAVPLATPWTLALVLWAFGSVHTALGLPGVQPEFAPLHMMFGTLMGSVIVAWSLARLHLGLPLLGRYDALARWLFSTWQVYAVLTGASPLLLAFTVIEMLFGVLQVLPYRREARAQGGAAATA